MGFLVFSRRVHCRQLFERQNFWPNRELARARQDERAREVVVRDEHDRWDVDSEQLHN